MSNLIKNTLSQNGFWILNKKITQHFKSLEIGAYLSILVSKYMYYEDKNELDEENMFFATKEQIEEESYLSDEKQLKFQRILENDGVITTEKKGLPRRTFFKINFDRIEEILSNPIENKSVTSTPKTQELVPAKHGDCSTENTGTGSPETREHIYNKNKRNKNKEIRTKEKEELKHFDNNFDIFLDNSKPELKQRYLSLDLKVQEKLKAYFIRKIGARSFASFSLAITELEQLSIQQQIQHLDDEHRAFITNGKGGWQGLNATFILNKINKGFNNLAPNQNTGKFSHIQVKKIDFK